MILNPFRCEKCKRELQLDDILVTMNAGCLIKVCGFCGHEVEIK